MAGKITTLAAILAITLLLLYGLANFYTPKTTNENTSLQQVDKLATLKLEFTTSWAIPNKNYTFTHNSTYFNGTRTEFFTIHNNDNSTRTTGLLVVIPKKVASDISTVSSTHEYTLLERDPALFLTLTAERGEVVNRAILITQTTSSDPIIAIPLPGEFNAMDASALLRVFNSHQRLFNSLTPGNQQPSSLTTYDLSATLASLIASTNSPTQAMQAVDLYLQEMENTAGLPRLNIEIQPPQPLKVSSAVTYATSIFNIPACLYLPCPANHPGPYIRTEQTNPGVESISAIAPQRGNSRQVRIDVDLTTLTQQLLEMEQSEFTGPFEEVNAVFSYPEQPGRVVSIPISIQLSEDIGLEIDGQPQPAPHSIEYPLNPLYTTRPIPGAQVGAGFKQGSRLLQGTEQPHTGVDYVAIQGTEIISPADGTVTRVRPNCRNPRQCPCGNGVYIQSTVNGKEYLFKSCHLKDVYVTRGQQVLQGEAIGTVGATGKADGPHLHFETYDLSGPVLIDPEKFFETHSQPSGSAIASSR